MRRHMSLFLAASALTMTSAAMAETKPKPEASAPDSAGVPEPAKARADHFFVPGKVASSAAVTIGGVNIAYDAEAGTQIVHPTDWDDAQWREKAATGDVNKEPPAEASIFYTAYFKHGAASSGRPITFLFNGGPGSSTVWLHMGAFGPKRVITADDSHTPPPPYRLVDNAYSLLDASDLVFIDAPGTGFSRIAGKDKEKAFWGVDADAHAFAAFIKQFLTDHHRWNSPKYLFGESNGTPRASVLINQLQNNEMIDFNGVILLSATLNFDLWADAPQLSPGSDTAYVVTLPTYAATAWYHNRLGATRPADLPTFLKEVEHFATHDYALALMEGSELSADRKKAVAEQMSRYIGVPADYIATANLRLSGGQFSQQLQIAQGLTTGRLDTRFAGPAVDPQSKEAAYDPQSASIGSAYVSAFNAYARDTLHYGATDSFKPEINVGNWDMNHKQPDGNINYGGATNVLNDLGMAMKLNPKLKVLVAGGYFDLATPYFEGLYEMHHLPIPDNLQANISYAYYPSGHMVYAHEASLKDFHSAVAGFIGRTAHGDN